MKNKSTKKKAKKTKKRVVFSAGDEFVANVPPVERTNEERLRDQVVVMGAMAQAIHAQGEREADYTERLNKMYGR